jgi:hypothetical protein
MNKFWVKIQLLKKGTHTAFEQLVSHYVYQRNVRSSSEPVQTIEVIIQIMSRDDRCRGEAQE